jgi:hypothetical protein
MERRLSYSKSCTSLAETPNLSERREAYKVKHKALLGREGSSLDLLNLEVACTSGEVAP